MYITGYGHVFLAGKGLLSKVRSANFPPLLAGKKIKMGGLCDFFSYNFLSKVFNYWSFP